MNMPMPMTMNGQFPNSRQEIVKVKGENGARMLPMGANCSAIALDEDNPIVWLVQTDGAGYKTVSPYSITPYQPAPPIDLNSIEERLKRIEAIIDESDIKSNASRKNKSTTGKADVEQS